MCALHERRVLCGARAPFQRALRRLLGRRRLLALVLGLGLALRLGVHESPRDCAVHVDAEGVEIFLARDRSGLPDTSASCAAQPWTPRRKRAWRRRGWRSRTIFCHLSPIWAFPRAATVTRDDARSLFGCVASDAAVCFSARTAQRSELSTRSMLPFCAAFFARWRGRRAPAVMSGLAPPPTPCVSLSGT